MLSGVNLAIHTQDRLGTWDLDVVQSAKAEMFKARAPVGPGREGELRTGGPAVKIQSQNRLPSQYGGRGGAQYGVERGIALKHGRKAVFHNNGQAEIRTKLFQ